MILNGQDILPLNVSWAILLTNLIAVSYTHLDVYKRQVIEHDFPGGRMVDHYFVTPSPAFWADEGVQSLAGVSGILFLQQPDGAPWKILVHEPVSYTHLWAQVRM